MKKIILTLSLIVAMISFVTAQTTEMKSSMSMGEKPGVSVLLKNQDKKEVEKEWMKYLKKYDAKSKKDKKKDEIFSDNAEIENMSNNTVDVYAQMVQKGTDTELNVWYDMGGAFLSSATHPDRIKSGLEIVDGFVLVMDIAAAEEEVKAEEGKLKEMNGDLKSLEKDKSSLLDDIAKYEKKIEEARTAIEENATTQQAKAAEIAAQERAVTMKKESLKSLEKQ